VHNKLKWDIEQNNILITFLNSRLEEAQKRIVDKEQEIVTKEGMHVEEVKGIHRKNEEDRLREIQEAKDRQREVSVDCPLDREYVAELL
jgi:hypothetical protein